jgi:hypothetical protein
MMKKTILIFFGGVLLLVSFCNVLPSSLPDQCGPIASGIDGAELLIVDKNKVKTPLGTGSNYFDGLSGLTKNSDDVTHRIYDVDPACGDVNTLVQRAYDSKVLVPAKIVVGSIGGLLLLIAVFSKPRSAGKLVGKLVTT